MCKGRQLYTAWLIQVPAIAVSWVWKQSGPAISQQFYLRPPISRPNFTSPNIPRPHTAPIHSHTPHHSNRCDTRQPDEHGQLVCVHYQQVKQGNTARGEPSTVVKTEGNRTRQRPGGSSDL